MAHRDTLAVAEQKDNEERRKSNSAGGRRKKGWGSKKRGIQHEHERRREAGRKRRSWREGGGGKGKRADRGIIIKRDISYVGGRIVSATRHARRFCVPAVRARALRP